MSIKAEYRDRSPIYSRAEAVSRNEAAGFHFFERATMQFFHSRVGENFYTCEARRRTYFVSSEQNRGFGGQEFARKFTVRAIEWDSGDVRTVGDFQTHRTQAVALRHARNYAAGEAEPVSYRDAGSHAVAA